MMNIDLHVHSAISHDGAGKPAEVLLAAKRAGLDGIGITEHNDFARAEAFLAPAASYGLAVFIGAELATPVGHFLVFSEDISRWSRYNESDLHASRLIAEVNAAGGAVIAAHPCRRGCPIWEIDRLPGLTALEVLNGGNSPQENRQAEELAAAVNLPGTGGSDAHLPREVGRCYTAFQVSVRTLPQLVVALRSGCYTPMTGK